MNIAIVDDVKEEFSEITEILKNFALKNRITFDISYFQSGEEFLDTFREENFDIIFMDIYMDGMTGIETAKEIRRLNSHCLIIFLTTSIEHMPDAFSCHAFEYIHKPINEKRVAKVMMDAMNTIPKNLLYIEFTSKRKIIRMFCDDLVSVVSCDHYLNITDCKGNIYRTRKTFSDFIKMLEPDRRFLQINKGILISMDYIISIKKNICALENGQLFPIRVRDSLKIKEIWYHYGFERIRNIQKRETEK